MPRKTYTISSKHHDLLRVLSPKLRFRATQRPKISREVKACFDCGCEGCRGRTATYPQLEMVSLKSNNGHRDVCSLDTAGSVLWASLSCEPYYLGSTLGPLIFWKLPHTAPDHWRPKNPTKTAQVHLGFPTTKE